MKFAIIITFPFVDTPIIPQTTPRHAEQNTTHPGSTKLDNDSGTIYIISIKKKEVASQAHKTQSPQSAATNTHRAPHTTRPDTEKVTTEAAQHII